MNETEDTPPFTADRVCGFVLNALSGIGIFCFVIAICFFLGYLS